MRTELVSYNIFRVDEPLQMEVETKLVIVGTLTNDEDRTLNTFLQTGLSNIAQEVIPVETTVAYLPKSISPVDLSKTVVSEQSTHTTSGLNETLTCITLLESGQDQKDDELISSIQIAYLTSGPTETLAGITVLESGQAQKDDKLMSSLQTSESIIEWENLIRSQTSDIILDQQGQTKKMINK